MGRKKRKEGRIHWCECKCEGGVGRYEGSVEISSIFLSLFSSLLFEQETKERKRGVYSIPQY
jgi:hypothetical protein